MANESDREWIEKTAREIADEIYGEMGILSPDEANREFDWKTFHKYLDIALALWIANASESSIHAELLTFIQYSHAQMLAGEERERKL